MFLSKLNNMKTIQKEQEILRVEDVDAESQVKYHGWKYVPKSLYKQLPKVEKTLEVVISEDKGKTTKDKKVEKRIKIKSKQRQY